jgi:hypothetical protein
MSDDFDKAFSTHHVEKLTDSNYRSWSVKIKAIFRAKQLLSIVDGSEVSPTISEDDAQDAERLAAHTTSLQNYKRRSEQASAYILSTISAALVTYVEDHDEDPAAMWTILQEKYRPISTVSRSQVLREFHTLKLEDNGDLEAHLRNFHTIKRKLDEQGIKFDDSVYKSALLSSLPEEYTVTASIIEANDSITTEMAENRLMEEARKKGMDESAMHGVAHQPR